MLHHLLKFKMIWILVLVIATAASIPVGQTQAAPAAQNGPKTWTVLVGGQAGVTDTPAARKIPGSEKMFASALESNPGKRLTTPEDVAEVLLSLSLCKSHWLTGNVIRIDGGEDLV